ncbi:MAG: FAD:protein FMN transferase [Ruminococcus sp.]|nr:FAD:protein FMN transferase [Ruminococcus sp.]
MIFKKILICAVCAASLTGCGKRNIPPAEETYSDRNVFAMDTFMTIRAYGDNVDEALKSAEEKIKYLESIFSVTIDESDIYKINNSHGSTVEIFPETAEILGEAVKMCEKTDGALDITLYPVLSAWGFTADEFRVPASSEIAGLLEYVDYSEVSVDGQSVTVPEGFQLDFGAIAKGYTSDEIADDLRENGVKSAVINLGGNIRTLGKKPDGSLWKIAVRDPFDTSNDLCVLETGEISVVTSGNYERYFEGDDGQRYWHILDPSDGFPADSGLVSVTVIGESGLYCDALSTALFVMGKDKAVEFWRKNQDFDMILVTDLHEIIYTSGIENSFENLTEMSAEVIDSD